MMNLKILFIILFITTTSFAGDRVGNGGGIAEKNILHAFFNLNKFIKLCLTSPSCQITKKERELLRKIRRKLSQEATIDLIRFSSEKDFPGRFILDGDVKIAKTGNKIGSPILINTDLLYRKNSAGVYVSFSVPEATSLLIHELGHHHEEYDHSKLDLLGIKVSMMLQKNVDKAPFFPNNSSLEAISFNGSIKDSFPEVLIYIGDQILDISRTLKAEIKCKKGFSRKTPLGATFHNLYWDGARRKGLGKKKPTFRFWLLGSISSRCKKRMDKGTRNLNFEKYSIYFEAKYMNFNKKKEIPKWNFISGSLKIKKEKESWISKFTKHTLD